jgi:hypothetical protein
VLVVSNIDLAKKTSAMKPSTFLNTSVSDHILNINNDYRYMKMGYYVSLHAEVLGNFVIPHSEDAIDAYRHPIMLVKASKHGIPTLPFTVTDSAKQIIAEIGFPTLIFAVNPFSNGGFKIARNKSALYRVLRSFGLGHKFTVCAQPLMGEMVSVKAMFGKCGSSGSIGEIARRFYEVFRLPICRLHVQKVEEKAYLCGVEKLGTEEITAEESMLISKEVFHVSKIGEKFWLE